MGKRAADCDLDGSRANWGGRLCTERFSDTLKFLSGGLAGATWTTFCKKDLALVPMLAKTRSWIARVYESADA